MPFIQHSQPEPEERDPEMSTHAATTTTPETKPAPPTPSYELQIAAEAKAIRSLKKIMARLDAQQRARFVAHVVEAYGTR